MAGYTLNWQDFMRRPEIKVLLETKGMVAVKQRYAQEQNMLMWNDPVMLTENDSAAGQSVSNNNSAGGGGTDYITGFTAEASTLTWANGLTTTFTSSVNHPESASLAGTYWDIEGLVSATDYSAGHTETRKVFRCYVVSSSNADYSADIPSNVVGVVTASFLGIAGANTIATASLNNLFRDAINNNSATSVQAGFTNTIAPNTLFTASVSSGNGSVLTITNNNAGGVTNISSVVGGATTATVSATASTATTIEGNDTWYSEQGAQTFDGNVAPWNNIPRLV